jgi:hypothetical protein
MNANVILSPVTVISLCNVFLETMILRTEKKLKCREFNTEIKR